MERTGIVCISSNLKKQKTYRSIDCTKFLLSLFVVGIHTDPFEKTIVGMVAKLLVFSLAVPMFFSISGYFISSKCKEQSNDAFVKYCMHIGKMYLVWTILYLPEIIREYRSHQGWGLIKDGRVVLLRNLFVCGSYNQLWYLIATIWGGVLLYLSYKYIQNEKIIVLLCGGICVISMLLDSCAGMIPMSLRYIGEMYQGYFVSVRNGVLFGFPFMGVGICARLIEKEQTRKSVVFLSINALVLFTLRAIATFVIKHYDMDFGMVITPGTWTLSLLMMLLLLQVEMPLSQEMSIWLRKSSTLVFLIHPYMIRIAKLLTVNNMMIFFITIGLSLLFSAVVISLEKTSCFKCIKVLY